MTNETFSKTLGRRIRELRKMNGMSQLDLANEMEVTLNTVSGIECGKTSPKLDTLYRMALALEIGLEDFFSFPEEFPRDKNVRKKVENLSRQLLLLDEPVLDLVLENVNLMLKMRDRK